MPKTIIIGAGPGGLTAGRYLEDALILEQKKEIGRPVKCAEGISRKALEIQNIKPDPSWISSFIDTLCLIVPNGKTITLKGKERGCILDRALFEKFLASQSKAKIQLETKVVAIKREDNIWEVKTEKGEVFRAEYLIGADGPLSIVRREVFKEKVGILPTIGYLVELGREIDLSTIKMYFDHQRYPNGYVWMFPKSRRTANIGLGGKRNLEERFKEFMGRVVEKEFGNYEILENRSGIISWGGVKLRLSKDNALLVGDAGGLVDPVFGGGISNAMVSGRIAAESILKKEVDLYESRIKSMPFCRPDLLLAQKILYSLPNSVLNQLAEVLEKKDIFYLKSIPAFLKALSKPSLRKNFWPILKLFSILEKGGSLG